MIESNDEKFQDNLVLVPRLYYKNGHLFVIYEIQILQEFESFIDAMIYLYGFYFEFDFKYPDCYKQVMGFFHEFLYKNFQNVPGGE